MVRNEQRNMNLLCQREVFEEQVQVFDLRCTDDLMINVRSVVVFSPDDVHGLFLVRRIGGIMAQLMHVVLVLQKDWRHFQRAFIAVRG